MDVWQFLFAGWMIFLTTYLNDSDLLFFLNSRRGNGCALVSRCFVFGKRKRQSVGMDKTINIFYLELHPRYEDVFAFVVSR